MTRPRAVALALILVAGLALAGCATVTAARVTGYPSTSINVPLAQVACTRHDACVAVGTSLLSTGPTSTAEYRRTNGSWVALRAPVAPTSSISAVACARSRCLFGGTSSAGDLVWLFTSSPPRLTALAPPPDGIAVEAISCVGASTCEVVDAAGPTGPARLVVTRDAGTSWSTPAPIDVPAGYRVTGLSCVSLLACVLSAQADVSAGSESAASGPLLLATRDGGITWTARGVPSAWLGVGSLTCDPRHCDALATTSAGTALARSGPEARGWSTHDLGASANSLACTTHELCVIVGVTHHGPWVATTHGNTVTVAKLSYVPTSFTVAGCGDTVCALANASTVATLRP